MKLMGSYFKDRNCGWSMDCVLDEMQSLTLRKIILRTGGWEYLNLQQDWSCSDLFSITVGAAGFHSFKSPFLQSFAALLVELELIRTTQIKNNWMAPRPNSMLRLGDVTTKPWPYQ